MEQPIRLTLRWVVLVVLLLFATGVAGGMVGQKLLAPPLPPLTSGDQLITQVQEVTISPNSAAADTVVSVSRSVMLLGTRTGTVVQPVATGVVVTNDGLLATTTQIAGNDIVAIDDTGAVVALEAVGEDPVFGLFYWRIPQVVVVPLDLRREPVAIGSELLAISRSNITKQTKVIEYRVQELILPTLDDPRGQQQLVMGTGNVPTLMVGAPAIDEEGRLSGLLLGTEGRLLPTEALQQSLARLAADQREFSPLEQLGLDLEYSFDTTFVARIRNVTPGTPAALAKLQRGDTLLTINNEPIVWDRSVIGQLSASLPLSLTFRRGEETLSAQVSANPTE